MQDAYVYDGLRTPIGRHAAGPAALLAGPPTAIGGLTVNRLCGSGLAAVVDAARAASTGQGALFIAGGVESMSRAPFVMAKSESAFSRDFKMFDSTIGARFPNPRIAEGFGQDTMPETADNVAHDHQIGREDSDRFALASQEKYARAKAAGFYDKELLPVSVPGPKKGSETVIAQDEHPRPNTTMERLAELKPPFPNGVVTPRNPSGLNDAAAPLGSGPQ